MTELTDQRRTNVGRSYTAGRRQPYLIRKFPGSRWTLPLGPYTLTQLVVLVGSIFALVQTRTVWAHFGPINLVIAVGVPIVLTFAARRTRIEGRDPLRAGVAALAYLVQPRAGYLRGHGVRAPAPVTTGCGEFTFVDLDTLLDLGTSLEVVRVPAAAPAGPGTGRLRRKAQPAAPATAPAPPRQLSLAELLTAANSGGH